MNSSLRRYFLYSFFVFLSIAAEANGVKIGDLYYILKSEDMTASVTYAAEQAPSSYSASSGYKITDLVVPDIVEYEGESYTVTSVKSMAFCEVVSSTAVHPLKTVTLPSTVTTIGSDAFRGCYSLTSIVGTENITSIGSLSFWYCALTEFIGPKVTTVGSEAFKNCSSLTKCELPIVESVGSNAFASTKIQSFIVPETLSSYPISLMPGELIIADSDEILKISQQSTYFNGYYTYSGALQGATLNRLYVGRPLSYSIYKPQSSNILTPLLNATVLEFDFGPSVTEIGSYFFYTCKFMTGRIEIPSHIIAIGSGAFHTSDRPSVVEYRNENPQDIAADAFSTDYYNETELHVPKGTKDKYLSCTGWKNFVNIIDDLDPVSVGEDDVTAGDIAYVFMRPEEELDFSSLLKTDVTVAGWESSNVDVVEVTRRGKAYAYEFGTAMVAAKDVEGKSIGRIAVFVSPLISVVYPEGGTVSCRTVYNSPAELDLTPAVGWKINNVIHDGVDVTDKVDPRGHYSTSPILTDTRIVLALEKEIASNLNSVKGDSPVKVAVSGKQITVSGAPANQLITATNSRGQIVYSSSVAIFDLPGDGIYLITIGDRVYKIII